MNLIQKNSALLQIDSSFIHSLEKVEGCSPVIFESRHPYNFAYFKTESKNYPLHSLRGPEEEAERLVRSWRKECSNQPGVYVLLGITGMHIITEFLKRLDKNSELVVVEPSPLILREFLEKNDVSELSKCDAAFTLLCPFEERIEKQFRKFINSRDSFCKGIFISPANLRFRQNLLETKKELTNQIRLEALDRVTTAKFADEWTQNCLINLPEIIQSPGINNFYSQFSETECFVVCAGPSLNDSLELIKEKQEQAFIISVGTALKPLLGAGITPDLTIVVDSDPKVYKQFDGVENSRGYLLATHTIFPGIYQKFIGRTICFKSIVSKHFSDWLIKAGIDHGELNVGGTVALSAIDCALKLDFRKTFIFGLDLAFADDGTSHAKNSMYQGQKVLNNLVEIPGNWNKKVKTTKQFAYYVEILRGYIMDVLADQVGKFFSVNNEGAKIGSLNVIHPEDLNNFFTPSSQNYRETLKDQFKNIEQSGIDELCENSILELSSINEKCRDFLSKIQNGRIPENLEEFENSIRESEVSNTLTAPALNSYLLTLNNQVNPDPVEMTKNFLTQLGGASEWIEGLLNNSYKRYLNYNKGVENGA